MTISLMIDKSTLNELKEDLKIQLFKCDAYSCTMTKYACYERRYIVSQLQATDAQTKTGAISESAIQLMTYTKCIGCIQDWPDSDDYSVRHLKAKTPVIAIGPKRGPKPKPTPSHCPKCDRVIDPKNPYARYNHKRAQCIACCHSERNKIMYDRKKEGKNIDVYCDNTAECGIANCYHASPHKHTSGKAMIHECTMLHKRVTCTFKD